MNKIRVFFVYVCSITLLLVVASGGFLFFIYDRIEKQALDYALSVAPDALSHSDAIKKKVYCPGSEVYIDLNRPEIKGYRKITNIELLPKPVALENGDSIGWGACKVFYRTFNFLDLTFWTKAIRSGMLNKILFYRINDAATEKGIITFRVPSIDELAGRVIEFDMSAIFVLPGKGAEKKEVDVYLKDLFVNVSTLEFYREIKEIQTANQKKKHIAVMIFIFSSAGFVLSLACLGVARMLRRRAVGSVHHPPLPA